MNLPKREILSEQHTVKQLYDVPNIFCTDNIGRRKADTLSRFLTGLLQRYATLSLKLEQVII